MRKNNGTIIHTNVLYRSIADTVALGDAIETRFLELCKDYLRIKHEHLSFPADLDSDVFLWRCMRMRHKKGDFRNTDDELKSTRRIAEWTLHVKCSLTNREYVPIEWGD